MKRDTAVDVLICQSFSKICKREKSKLVDYSDLNVTALFRTTSPSVSHYQRFHLLKLFPFIICCCAAVKNPTHLFHSLNFLIYLSTEVTNFHLSNPMQPVRKHWATVLQVWITYLSPVNYTKYNSQGGGGGENGAVWRQEDDKNPTCGRKSLAKQIPMDFVFRSFQLYWLPCQHDHDNHIVQSYWWFLPLWVPADNMLPHACGVFACSGTQLTM